MLRWSTVFVLAAMGSTLGMGGVRAADLDYGYAPPPPVERVYERSVVVEEPVVVERPVVLPRPVALERPVVVPRPYYRPFYRPWGYYRPYRPVFGPRFAYGPRPWGWYR